MTCIFSFVAGILENFYLVNTQATSYIPHRAIMPHNPSSIYILNLLLGELVGGSFEHFLKSSPKGKLCSMLCPMHPTKV